MKVIIKTTACCKKQNSNDKNEVIYTKKYNCVKVSIKTFKFIESYSYRLLHIVDDGHCSLFGSTHRVQHSDTIGVLLGSIIPRESKENQKEEHGWWQERKTGAAHKQRRRVKTVQHIRDVYRLLYIYMKENSRGEKLDQRGHAVTLTTHRHTYPLNSGRTWSLNCQAVVTFDPLAL